MTYAFQTPEGRTVLSINREMSEIWLKQKALLDPRAQVIAGKEQEFDALETSYQKLLQIALQLSEKAKEKATEHINVV